ncbi:MAG TPA: ROK family protein [Chitinophagaceae bacterium]|nr:ROK family protein [Chitinophagaceae bacterium]
MPVIAFDLGGTKLSTALFSDEGQILFLTSYNLDKRAGKEVGELIIRQAGQTLQIAREKNLTVSAIGIGIPGIAHAQTGTVWAPNIPGWDDYPLRKELEDHFRNNKISIRIESDRACYILGEQWKGNAANCRDAIFLSVGTGIGAGILVNGQILRGAHDIGGAIGWLALDNHYHDKYRACGCFEYNASGQGLGFIASALLNTGNFKESILARNQQPLSSREIFTAYHSNDPLAVEVINNAIAYWGKAVANLVSLFNPEKIIFGGGVFGPALAFLDRIYAEAIKWAQPISIRQVQLEGSALGHEAGLYGAGWLALNE